MLSKPISVAVALFVKNEFSDIAGWIAWHAAWGITTFFIYDDHSSDGTFELLQAAAKCYDVRVIRTDPEHQPDFYLRQKAAFMDAAQQARGVFDWIGFLDGDEYLYLRHHDTIQSFLASFAHADGIAFSWRIHGSAGRVVRPRETTVSAFPHHSTTALNDNSLVKSFVRPNKVGAEYINPHWFDVPTERYVRPDGVAVESANAVQTIDWSHGFVMHYVCRSMEHYVQRIKRRLNVDLNDSDGYMKHFDRNDILDEEPLKLIPRTEALLLPIYEIAIDDAIIALRALGTSMGYNVSTQADAEALKPCDEKQVIYRFETFFSTGLFYSVSQRCLLHTTLEIAQRHSLLPVYGVQYEFSPSLISIFALGHEGPLKIALDERLMRAPLYSCIRETNGCVFLRNPASNLYLSSQNPDSGSNAVEANRRGGDEWERLTLIQIEEHTVAASYNTAQFFAHRPFTAKRVLQWIAASPARPDREAFLRVFYQAPPSVREELSCAVPGLLWNIL